MAQPEHLANEPAAGTPQRVGWVDAAKGIGILLVVLGHNQVNSYLPIFHLLVFSFHMPLFFLLAGMFFKPEYGLWTLAKRRFFSTLRPYLLAIVLIYATSLFFTTQPLATVVTRALKSIFYSLPIYLDTWIPLWFLPHLFLVSLFVWVVFRLVYVRLGPLWLRLAFLGAMLLAGVLALGLTAKINLILPAKLTLRGGLPWSADLLLITGAFFLGGYELRRSLPEQLLASKWIGPLCGALWLGLCLVFPYQLDLAGRRYDFFAVTTLELLAACLMVFSLSYHLEKAGNRLFRWLSYLGRVSIVVLIFHGPIQFFTFYKVMDLVSNAPIAASIAFLAGVGVPLIICETLLRGNPRLAGWFGLAVE